MRLLGAGAALAALVSSAAAQGCISLAGSIECPAFNASSISTDASLVALYPFLQYVTDRNTFDSGLRQYVSQGYVQRKYVNILGCDNVNFTNTTNYYARYTTSFLCNGIVQNSQTPCGLTGNALRPLCSDSCGSFATSEDQITVTDALCSGRNTDYLNQIRADFTNCALPGGSITSDCIPGYTNEASDCGFRTGSGTNMIGLCNYCRDGGTNSTDSCCLGSNAVSRCADVTLPAFASVSSFVATPTSSSSTSASTGSGAGTGSNIAGGGRLSGGAIAGIVIGSVVGFLLFLGLIIFCCIAYRRRRRGNNTGVAALNQPSPQRKGGDVAAMTYNPPASAQGYEVLPGGRVARMSAMQTAGSPQPGPRQYNARELYGDSPISPNKIPGVIGAVKTSPGSHGSSPGSNDFSSPEGAASGQSEQLPFFKDYYSNDDIHSNDKVSVLWAYQPRAGDEFELERGDMLKVVGIWDDGWATGVRIEDRAEDYDGKNKAQRDSGVSNGSVLREDSPTGGEIKAFPLVCVCLPEAWKKTVEGDSSAESGSGGHQM